jgi:hypothetical protein
MNNTRTGGPSLGLLLLIPAAALVAHAAAHHHRMMWDEIGEPTPADPRRRHGQRHGVGPEFGAAARDGFRLPPRIEWMLEAWHARAHATPPAGPEVPDPSATGQVDAPSA